VRSRHLTRNGTARVFQIRLPKRLDPDFHLAPIRITLGPTPNSRARRVADILAGLARIEFERIGAQPILPEPAAARRSVEQLLALTVPTLLGMNALADSRLSDEIREPATEAAFDALAQLGLDRATGRGVFANGAIRFEAPFVAALREENPARALIGQPLLPTKEADPIQNQLDAIQAQQAELLARLAPQMPGPKGSLFSLAADKAIAAKRETHGPTDPEIGSLDHRKTVFVGIVGDKPVDAYSREDLQTFANALAWLPPNISKQSGCDLSQIKEIIATNREKKAPGLSQNSIKSYLNRIKGILRQACTDARVPIGFAGRIVIPKRAAPPKRRTAPAHDELGRVVAAGVASGILSDALLVPLGLLTGRRIGLLAHMRRENIKRYNGAWVCFPQSHEWRDGAWCPIPFKTDESLSFFVLHDIFAECGFIDWAQRECGPVFPALMMAKDPADAAQKRMGRLYRTAEADPQRSGTFHALRTGKIRNDRELRLDPRAVRLQVGHELGDTHERYDGQLTDAELAAYATAPLPPGVDWTLLKTIDFEAYARCQPKGGRRKKTS
jgi:integrase